MQHGLDCVANTSVYASIILFPGSFYCYLSPTGNRKIAFCFFYGYLSPTGNYYIMLFLCYGYLSSFDEAYGKSSINPFSRRECISIEKHYKRCCFPVGFGVSSVERGFILLCFLCYGYLSPTGKYTIHPFS